METRKALTKARAIKRERLIEQASDYKNYAESHFLVFS
jgi:hypothetical protein